MSTFLTTTRRPGRGDAPWFRYGYQQHPFAFDWWGGPGGIMGSRPAAESRELAGGTDLVEAGANPYTLQWPALAHRGLSGIPVWDHLSSMEKTAVAGVALVGAALLIGKKLRKGRRR